MSTRYVWGKYSETRVIGYIGSQYQDYMSNNESLKNGFTLYYSDSYEFDGDTVSLTNPSNRWVTGLFTIPASKYFMLNSPKYTTTVNSTFYSDLGHLFRGNAEGTSQVGSNSLLNGNRYPAVYIDVTNFGFKVARGTLQSYVSSASDGQYPADGVSGNSYVSAHSLHLSRTIPRRKIHQYQPIQGIVLAVSYGEGLGHFDETAA